MTPAAIDPERPRTFPEVLSDWAEKAPDRQAYLYLVDGEREESSLTFRQLRDQALAVAGQLSALARRGDRVLLFYPSGLDFIVAFLGCLCAGVVAVPVSVPNRKRGMEGVSRIAANSGAKCLLSVGALLARYAEDFASDAALASLPRIDTTAWSLTTVPASVPAQVDVNSPALLQYTSGSTGQPRGVIVTHANLAHNQAQQQACMRNDEQSVIVSWLPMFHDMGLGTVLQGLWVGARCVLMSPSAFLQKPARWLRAISRYRGTRSGGPDFAFDLCVRNVTGEHREGLDLSSWTYAYNGSEPVRSTTLRRFSEAFSPCGFRWEAFHALYGLAEATLFVTGEPLEEAPDIQSLSRVDLEKGLVRSDPSEDGQPVVGCGSAWLEGRVLIVDPDSFVECAADSVGEIWVASSSVAAGYWGREEDTRETFHARTASGQGPFLRTGDLGFLRAGKLFVAGRSKDLIIVRGRNHYPQDVEDTVSNCHPALEPQRCAAFAVETDEGEGVVVAQEVKRSALRSLDSKEVLRSIRHNVAERHGLAAAAIVLLRPLSLPRTTSGKVRRKACRDAFLGGSLAQVASSGLVVGSRLKAPKRMTLPPPHSSAARLAQWLQQYPPRPTAAPPGRGPAGAPEAMAEIARQGLLGMQVGTEHGGLALRHAETVRVLEQMGGVDLRASLFVGFNNYLGVGPILRHGDPCLQQELLSQLATGKCLAGFAFAEPGTDTDVDAWRSQVERVNGSGWKLQGEKVVTGAASDAALWNVFMKHPEGPGVSGFVVPRDASGTSQASGVTDDGVLRDTLRLDGVFVEHRRVLGRVGQGQAVAVEAIRHSHLAIGAACLGGMKRCSQLIFQHATQRQIGDTGVVAHPVTMTRLGRITAEVTALESLVRMLADLVDEGCSVGADAFAVCKLVGPTMLWQAVDDLVQLLGRRGVVETSQVRQLVDDARVLRGLEGPAEAGSAVLGAELQETNFQSLRELAGEVFRGVDLEPMLRHATKALQSATLGSAGGLPASLHWIDARAGELATWIVLVGALESRRSATSLVDLERAAAWARSSFESMLSLTRNGPPPEVRVDASSADGATVASDGLRTYPPSATGADGLGTRRWAVAWLADKLRVDESDIDPRRSFADHGVDSLAAAEFAKALADRMSIALDETLLWNFPTIDALLEYLERAPQDADGETSSAQQPSVDRRAAPPASSTQVANVADELTLLERELKKRS